MNGITYKNEIKWKDWWKSAVSRGRKDLVRVKLNEKQEEKAKEAIEEEETSEEGKEKE